MAKTVKQILAELENEVAFKAKAKSMSAPLRTERRVLATGRFVSSLEGLTAMRRLHPVLTPAPEKK